MTKKEARKIWINALRSGDYKQGVNQLQSGVDRFCCLGVLAEEAKKHGIPVKLNPDGRIAGGTLSGHKEVMDWVGLENGRGWYKPEGSPPLSGLSLVTFNDNGDSFSKIADIIESEPEGLFNDEENTCEIKEENTSKEEAV